MNAVEIEGAVSDLALQEFDADEFPFAFLLAFGNKPPTVKRLKSGSTNKSDVGGVLQRNNIHMKVCAPGEVTATLRELRDSPATTKGKAKFIFATDGEDFEAEDLNSGETLAHPLKSLGEHFGFFLPLAGITTVRAIKDNPIDIKATARLNKLYVELLKTNPDWDSDARRHDLNQFMARLIFCFFAEDTGIFLGENLFTKTVEQMSQKDNAHELISELFRAMDIPTRERADKNLRSWADQFPYVNGGLFAGSSEVPVFSSMARSYLLHAGSLDWQAINPDIFGSMIQAVAEDEERGELGMHYTSVPNILKVLNPLFLDDLREQLEAAGDSPIKLLNLRKRLARIRVFDPACGSGNFLVIAYKEMRAIEAEILRRRANDKDDPSSVIPLANFFGIEIKDFACEIARLSLLIAEYQSDVSIMGQERAGEIVLPLRETGHIVCGNALRLDWLAVCPPTKQASVVETDPAGPTGRLVLEPSGGGDWETYICGNPPYVGDKKQTVEQKDDVRAIFEQLTPRWKSFDYVNGFIYLGAKYVARVGSVGCAFVTTNSVSQGVQVGQFWPLALENAEIGFARQSFKWSNLAARNAGVTCIIVGLRSISNNSSRKLFEGDVARSVERISPYLTSGGAVLVQERAAPASELQPMLLGNFAKDGGNLFLSQAELSLIPEDARSYVRPIFGAQEFIKGKARYCFWVPESESIVASQIPALAERFSKVRNFRASSKKSATVRWADKPFRFVEIRSPVYEEVILIPRVSSETREFLPTGLLPRGAIVTEAFGLYDAPLWNMAVIASRIHLVWIATVCGKLKTDFRYSNTLGWNTFPLPDLTEKNKADLTCCAEDILLAREQYFPATIANMYDPKRMDEEFPLVREAHERNDETLERIYIGRHFKNDTERLEKLFDMYSKMSTEKSN